MEHCICSFCFMFGLVVCCFRFGDTSLVVWCCVGVWAVLVGGFDLGLVVEKWGSKIVKNGPRVWAFCKIEFPGIQKPVQFFGQKSCFFEKCGNRGVGVIWSVLELGLGFGGVLL